MFPDRRANAGDLRHPEEIHPFQDLCSPHPVDDARTACHAWEDNDKDGKEDCEDDNDDDNDGTKDKDDKDEKYSYASNHEKK